MDRYIVYIRLGGAGIKDREHPAYDENDTNFATRDVVAYKSGPPTRIYPNREKKLNELLR